MRRTRVGKNNNVDACPLQYPVAEDNLCSTSANFVAISQSTHGGVGSAQKHGSPLTWASLALSRRAMKLIVIL